MKNNESTTDGNDDGNTISYVLEGNLNLILVIDLPRCLPIPPGFNKIGSKTELVEIKILWQNLSNISDA